MHQPCLDWNAKICTGWWYRSTLDCRWIGWKGVHYSSCMSAYYYLGFGKSEHFLCNWMGRSVHKSCDPNTTRLSASSNVSSYYFKWRLTDTYGRFVENKTWFLTTHQASFVCKREFVWGKDGLNTDPKNHLHAKIMLPSRRMVCQTRHQLQHI